MANGITRYYPHPEVVQLIFGQLLSFMFVLQVYLDFGAYEIYRVCHYPCSGN